MGLLANASDVARPRGHDWVGVEHLLLALAEAAPGTAARDALGACGVDEASVSAAVDRIAHRRPDRPRCVTVTPRLQRVEGIAQGFALASGSEEPLPEHLLLAIVWSRSQLLERVGTTPAAVQTALARAGVAVPTQQAPPPAAEFGEAFKVTREELRIVLDRIEPLLSPPEITVGVRWDGDDAWVRAAHTIDLGSEIEQLRSERA
jgi:ATP-dependent Clp protease ATP-binding subunit ClpA